MLVEVNDVRNVVLCRPDADSLSDDIISELQNRFRLVILTSEADEPAWRRRDLRNASLLLWNVTYMLAIPGNIRAALDMVGGEPHETLFATEVAEELEDAIPTRLGSVLVGHLEGDVYPDLVVTAYSDLARLDTRAGHRTGYLGELACTTIGGGAFEGVTGVLIQRGFVRSADIAGSASVIVLGRYFPMRRDLRAEKHQPSRRILELKKENKHGFLYLNALVPALEIVNERRPIDLLTRVPPRGGTDNLGELLRQAASRSDARKGTTLARLVELGVIGKTRDYDPQKHIGNFENRALNVDGAFRVDSDLAGKHIVLFDDLITSEHTAAECSRALLNAGATHVTILALGFNQGIVSGIPKEVPCTNETCDGHLVMRFNAQNHGAFWGCSQFHAGCREPAVSWLQGLHRLNALNTRGDIRDEYDIEF